MANRFEQVDEVVGDAVTVVLSQRADGQWATVVCPKSAHESLTADRITEPMAPKDALSGAVKLANQLKIAIVVQDPDGVWKKEWGELYREERGFPPHAPPPFPPSSGLRPACNHLHPCARRLPRLQQDACAHQHRGRE